MKTKCVFICVFLAIISPAAWGLGDIETATAEGGEVWQNNYQITGRRKGTYNYIVTAHDHAGNEAVSGPFNIKIDPNSGIPTVRVVYPEPHAVIRQNTNVLGTASGYFEIAKVTVRLNNTAPIEAEGTQYWSAPINFKGIPDGPHSMFFRATDSKGTTGPELRVDFILDTSPPKIDLLSHRIGDIITSNVKIKGTASDPNGIDRVEISEDGETYGSPDKLNNVLAATFNAALKSLRIKKQNGPVNFEIPVNIKDLNDGEKVYYVRAIDKTGAVTIKKCMFLINKPAAPGSTAGGLATFDVNAGVTSVIINTPAENEIITSKFDITGVTFGSVDTVYYRFLGPKIESIAKGPAGAAATEAALAYLANPDGPFSETTPRGRNITIPVDFAMITDGEYTCEIFVKDRAGVQSEIVTRTFMVSTGAPETKIISPPITRYNSHVILVRGVSSDANGIARVKISIDAGLTWQEVSVNDDNTWVIPLNTAIYKDRVYSVSILAEDNCGITSFTNAMVNLDNTPPDLVLSSPTDGQYVGDNMSIMARVADNIELKSLTLQVISVTNPNNRIVLDIPPQRVVFETFNMESFTPGEYIVRVISKDLADNESIMSRKVFYDPNDIDAQVAIYNPLPGEDHTGPVYVAGLVTGVFIPETVQLMLDGEEFQELEVDRYGVFRYDISEVEIGLNGPHRIYAHYKTEKGRTVASASHTVYYDHFGPVLLIDSHRDGDVITKRPWLRGRAMFVKHPKPDGKPYTRAEISEYAVDKIEISYDNGRTFNRAIGKGDWKWRLEPLDLPPGTQPVVVRATFANGDEAVRRVLLFVDAENPQVDAISPEKNTVHRDELKIFGSAGDNFDLTDIDVSLRPYDKFWYSVPYVIRGLYFDVKTLGATYFDVGVGLSFFDNNVRVQGQYGIAPVEGIYTTLVEGGRYVGHVAGFKLLANVFTLPFDWLFKDRDWEFYKMKFAVGANFSWFSMDERRSPLYIGAVLAQVDLACVDMNLIYPKWKYFHIISLYMQPEIWFTSTDAINVPKTIWRVAIGLKFNVF